MKNSCEMEKQIASPPLVGALCFGELKICCYFYFSIIKKAEKY